MSNMVTLLRGQNFGLTPAKRHIHAKNLVLDLQNRNNLDGMRPTPPHLHTVAMIFGDFSKFSSFFTLSVVNKTLRKSKTWRNHQQVIMVTVLSSRG